MRTNAHERRATPPQTKRSAKKLAAPEGAAKFREETPRKGGGFVTRDHNAALQQYAKFVAGWQAQNTLFQTFLRGNRAKIRQCA
jgi:hypothetical protein